MMGNRAIITTPEKEIGVYLHWNGDRSSVEAFVAYCALKGYRSPTCDAAYGFARLTQVIGNFFGGGLSVGVVGKGDIEAMAATLDNGIYLLDGWEITGREVPFENYVDMKCNDLAERLLAIDKRQPEREQMGERL